MKYSEMNVILASDDKFVPFCGSVIHSLLTYNDGVKVFVFTESMSLENQRCLKNLSRKGNNSIEILKVDEDVLRKFPMPDESKLSHISVATYFRLFAAELLPNVDKAIYIDCDILIRNSLRNLWDTDISDYYLGAVYHANSLSFYNGAFRRLSIPVSQGYFNAGVLLMNLKKWREDNIFNQCLLFIKNNYANILNHDQDVLNAVCGCKTKILSCRWNTTNSYFLTRFFYKQKDPYMLRYQKELHDVNGIMEKSVIVHFAFRAKPWEIYCLHPFAKDFCSHLRKAGFTLNKMEWSSFKGFYYFCLKPQIMGFGRFNWRFFHRRNIFRYLLFFMDCITEIRKRKQIFD